jgi:hypothetical protein
MTEKTKKLLTDLKQHLTEQAASRNLSRSELRLIENIEYFERREGEKRGRRNEKRPLSQLAKRFAQQGRESRIFRGSLQEAIRLREEALNAPEEVLELLEQETLEHESEQDEQQEDEQVLATSEQPKKRRRGRPKKKDND